MGLFSRRDEDEDDITVTGPKKRGGLFSKEGFRRFSDNWSMAANDLYRGGRGNDAIMQRRMEEDEFVRNREAALRLIDAADKAGTPFDSLTRQAVLEGDPVKTAEVLTASRLKSLDMSEGETHVRSPWMDDPKEQGRIYAPKTIETNDGNIIRTDDQGGFSTVREGTTAGTADRRAYVMEVTGVDIGNPQWGKDLTPEKKNEVMIAARDFALSGNGPTAIQSRERMNAADNATSRANTMDTQAGQDRRDVPNSEEAMYARIIDKVTRGEKITRNELVFAKEYRAKQKAKNAKKGRPTIDVNVLKSQLD